jgi:hypothetical protein
VEFRPDVAAKFVAAGTADAFDARCINDMTPAKFQ